MIVSLPAEVRAAGYRLAAFDTIGSTSLEATARARAGEVGPIWFVSDHQTAGTGRRGSAWQTPRGNLAASLLLATDLPPSTLAQLGFVAGVALIEALDACCTGARAPGSSSSGAVLKGRFALKWPNDVLADGAKLAGILLGTEEARGGRVVVVGVGVNVAHAPERLPYPATSLGGLGFGVDAASLFGALASAWLRAHALWDDGRGFAAIRRAWLARAAGLGDEIAVRTAATEIRGVFDTIDDHGHLVLRDADGLTRRVSAGDVHFGAAASAPLEEMA